jgi:hypothetical protein
MTIEALALQDAVAFVVKRNYNRVVFEVDCADVMM